MKKMYFLSKLKLNWIEAHITCKSYGMNLLSIESSEELTNIRNIYKLNSSIFEAHTYIGGTNLFNESWYWVGSGNQITLNQSEWIENGPNGQHNEEFCTDIYARQNRDNEIVVNDVPCRSTKYIWDFICERIVMKNEVDSGKEKLIVMAIILSLVITTCFVFFLLIVSERLKISKSATSSEVMVLVEK